MPEIMEEAIEKPVERVSTKPTIISTISGVVLSALVTMGVTDKIDQDTYQAKINRAKNEIVMPLLVPETITETLRDTIIKGDTVTLTDVDTIPQRKEYVRSYASTYIPTEGDTIIVTMTRKRGDSIMYYGVYPVTPEETPRMKISFDKMN